MKAVKSLPILIAFIAGLHFALLQCSYFFLMEAYLSSQYLSYFIILLFWLCGFLAGLNLVRGRRFALLLAPGIGVYYLAWWMTKVIPFHTMLYPSVAICAVMSGLLPGYFFPCMAQRFPSIKNLLFHENNGFILGMLISLKASIHGGSWFLSYGPLLSGTIVFLVLILDWYWTPKAPVADVLCSEPGR